MTDQTSKLPIRKISLIAASVGGIILLIAGTAADLFELSSQLGWWRVGVAFAVISLLVAVITGLREMRKEMRLERERLQEEMDALKRMQRDVEYLRTPADVLSKAASLLAGSDKSLEYYGGLNLINADWGQESAASDDLARWRKVLSERLRNERFTVTRYIDFLMPSELAGLYDDQHVPLRQIRDQVSEYTRWIDTQAQALEAGADSNAFYNLRGAPIWQWGMHVLIFDRKHVMIVFTNTRRNYRALVLSNEEEAAIDIHTAFETWHRSLRRQPISTDQLHAAVKDGRDWAAAHPEQGASTVNAHS